jgi:hypothetical protein
VSEFYRHLTGERSTREDCYYSRCKSCRKAAEAKKAAAAKKCAVVKCHGKGIKRGFCENHYRLYMRHGDPLGQHHASPAPGMDRAAKKAWVAAYKLEHGCADCGYNKHPAALDFDHLPGVVKVRDVKSGLQFGWEGLLAEVAKCEVVCANCHRIRTVERLDTKYDLAQFELQDA